MSTVRKALGIANACIDALNELHGTRTCRTVAGPAAARCPRVAETLRYIMECSQQYMNAATTAACGDPDTGNTGNYERHGGEPVESLQADKLSLPEIGGTFDAAAYLKPELAACLNGEPAALADPLVAGVAASLVRSYQLATDDEYAATVARFCRASMAELTATKAKFPLGLFAVLKSDGMLRPIVDGRPGNVFFLELPMEHCGGDDLCCMIVDDGYTLLVAKVDLADYFHTILARAGVRRFFGLRPVRAEALRRLGVHVPLEAIDEDGWTHPRLCTMPMGWTNAPALAQAANEAVLYGSAGDGSSLARSLVPLVDPAERLSAARAPDMQRGADLRCHSIIIDDLMMFKTVATRDLKQPTGAEISVKGVHAGGPTSQDVVQVCQRYQDVGARVRVEKVADYAPQQLVAGYQLDNNTLRIPEKKYAELVALLAALDRRGFALPREVERILGKFTNLCLLHRLSLSIFSSVYAFVRKLGHRTARVWPSVLRELQRALALLPVIRAELDRGVSPVLLQTDACAAGFGVVYTDQIAAPDLRREASRPRGPKRAGADPWTVASSLGTLFTAPVEPKAFRIAARGLFQGRERDAHINCKEASAVLTGVRWAARAPRTRRCRLVLQSDSAVVVGALRKGRSSKPGLLRRLRRLAALTLAERITLVGRHVSTERNMADSPSRGSLVPGPCVGSRPPYVRPRGRGLGMAARRIGEASNPGPPPDVFWTPLLEGRVTAVTLRDRYKPAVREFISFVKEHGDVVDSAEECEYWLAYYMHVCYVTGLASKSRCHFALYGIEFFMPEAKPLKLPRACMRGWDKLVPPTPYAPMPLDLCYAVAVTCVLAGAVAVGIAVLLSFDCLLRISEVAGLRVGDIVDHRAQADPVGRGVAVYLRVTKTGRRQAVMVEDPALAELPVAWQAAVARTNPGGLLFPPVLELRGMMNRALRALDDGTWETRGLRFVWHSLRHGSASRTYLRGGAVVLPDLLVRGRWAADASGRHYIQSGRQMLLALALPAEIAMMARALRAVGIAALASPDFRSRLAQNM